MNKGVHIRSVEVVLLVPGCSRQYNVRVSAGGVEAEVDIDKQIQLASRALIMPFDQLIVVSVPTLLQYVVLRTQQVFQEVLLPLTRSADQVTAPHEDIARPVDFSVRIGEGDIHCAG